MPFITYEKFLTKLDTTVCPVCRPFHGQIFKQGEGPQPVVSTHYGCRCRRVHHTTIFTPDVIPIDPQPDEEEYNDQ